MAKTYFGIDLARVKESVAVSPGRRKRKPTTLQRLNMARTNVKRFEKQLAREQAAREALKRDPPNLERTNSLAGWQMLLVRMVPGEWYARVDLVDIMRDYASGSVSWWLKRCIDGGLVERAVDPDWRAPIDGRTRYLFRLSARGEELRAGLAQSVTELGHAAAHDGVQDVNIDVSVPNAD